MRSSDGLSVVAIVGRPNVGKSTLFNRLIRRKQALVDDRAGVTRDRNYSRASAEGHPFWLVDTGGFTLWDASGIELHVQEQVDAAVDEADVILLLLDARTGLSAEDEEVTRTLLRRGKAVICAANKADNEALEAEARAIVAGGLGAVMPVSATTGRGVEELLAGIARRLPEDGDVAPESVPGATAVAIVGRPNVGKSSLVNAIVGGKQMVVDAVAGTTRDAVDTPVRVGDAHYVLIDTAGLRRRSRVGPGIELWSRFQAARALRRSDVCVLVLDATQEISQQDVSIAAEAWEEYKSVVVCVNKWDAVEKDHDTARLFEDRLSRHFRFLPDAPLLYVSALTGRRVDRILPEAGRLAEIRRRRVPTARVNEVLQRIVARHPPPSNRSSRQTRMLFASQVDAAPPTFAVFTNRPEHVEGHYTRFLRNRLKKELGFDGSPVKVIVRKREAGS